VLPQSAASGGVAHDQSRDRRAHLRARRVLKKEAAEVVESIFEVIKARLELGEKVKIPASATS